MSAHVPFGAWSLYSAAFSEAADHLARTAWTQSEAPTLVVHVNAFNAYLLSQDAELREALAREAFLVMDGIAMKLASRAAHGRWWPDLNGTDLLPMVMERWACRGTPVYLLGGTEETVRGAVSEIRRRWPGVPVVGARNGYFDPADTDAIIADVAASGAQALLVGCGCPLQERFGLRVRAARPAGLSLVWTVGGLFDFVSGQATRAPLPVRAARLEWAFRWAREPRRMLHRNVVVTPWLALQVAQGRSRRD